MTTQTLPAESALQVSGAEKRWGRDRGGQETKGNARHTGEKEVKLGGFQSKERRREAEWLEEEKRKSGKKVAVSCTWLETTHLRYTWAPFWALRAHYRKTEQNTETITHRDANTRSSKNLTLGYRGATSGEHVQAVAFCWLRYWQTLTWLS